MDEKQLQCDCGKVTLAVRGRPIASVECYCTTCRDAGERLALLAGAPQMVSKLGATPYVMYRKDRIDIIAGREELRAHRLTPESGTRRFLAVCCHTPMFMEFKGGHWLSVYGLLWSDAERPTLQLRTMTGGLDARDQLPDDVPNPKRHTFWFYRRLFAAWAAMGFRAPDLNIEGELHV